MCVSNNAFEHQAYNMSEKIKKSSIYQPVCVVYNSGRRVEITEQTQEPLELITKVILRDDEGNYYEIEPSQTGLEFSKGEITYMEYLKKAKEETKKLMAYLTLFVGLFFIMGFGIIKYFF